MESIKPQNVEVEGSTGSTHSYWMDSAKHKPDTKPLTENITVDTCVIGAGIAGLTTAYFLSKQGQRVAVLDKGEICSGETGRTTGYLTWMIDDGIKNIINMYGEDGAKLHVDSHRAAVDIAESIVKTEGIECEFRRVPGYWFSRKPLKEQKGQPDKDIQDEFNAMIDVGMTGVSIVDNPPFAGNDGKCIRVENQGQMHSVAYCYGLARAIQAAGGSIFTCSKVVEWKGGKEPYAKTEQGFIVKCKNLVMATNAPLQLITTIAKLEPYRTYIVGGEVPKGKYEWCMFQDDSMIIGQPYKYGRFTSLNETTDMLFVGGEDHPVGFEKNYEERYQNLEKWVLERFPDIKFTYRWSGQVQETVDMVAYIGKDPGTQNVYIMTGDSGMGMTHYTMGGKLISDIILNIPNPWKAFYDPKRIKLKALPEQTKHLAEINLQYKDYIKGGDVPDIEDIIPGEGAIICRGIHHYAVYKDEQGNVTASSAVCPHLKGRVRWNSLEKSWDCPVHGSRFDACGNVLNGPAKSNLERVKLEDVIRKK